MNKEQSMNRKQFLKRSGIICCAAASGLGTVLGDIGEECGSGQERSRSLSQDLNDRITEGAKSPEWNKADKARHWITSMVRQMDRCLDGETKLNLLQTCGRSCYINALGVADKENRGKSDLDQFLQVIEKRGFKVERMKDRAIIHYSWGGKQNPWGLSMKEGFCMCPIFESDTKAVSPSFCHCSTGYVMEGFERYSGRKIHKIEVVESILRGGKDCKFRIEILR
jgi:hypothetical protein